MDITRFSDRCLKALIYLARSKRQCHIDEIADFYQVSRHAMAKAIHRLGACGYVLDGSEEGLSLASRPEQINVGDVVLKTGRNLEILGFSRNGNTQPDAAEHQLRCMVERARINFLETFFRYTLADIVAGYEDKTVTR